MITFIAGMAAGAAALLGLFAVASVRMQRAENAARRRAKHAVKNKQTKPVGFCGDITRNNTWMQETAPRE